MKTLKTEVTMAMNLVTLGPIYGDTNTTIRFLRENRLMKREYVCCNNECKEVKSKSRDGFEFKCNICGKCYSLRTHSFFFNVHIPLTYLLLLTYLFSTSTPVKYCVQFLSGVVSDKTIGQWFHFLREVMSQSLICNHMQLGGRHQIVQIDESALGRKRKYNRGYERGSGLKWVFGGIDVSTKKCFWN